MFYFTAFKTLLSEGITNFTHWKGVYAQRSGALLRMRTLSLLSYRNFVTWNTNSFCFSDTGDPTSPFLWGELWVVLLSVYSEIYTICNSRGWRVWHSAKMVGKHGETESWWLDHLTRSDFCKTVLPADRRLPLWLLCFWPYIILMF